MDFIDGLYLREVDAGKSESFYRRQCVAEQSIQRLRHSYTLHGHDGCVNTLNWNESGTLLATGSDDQKIIIWHENGLLLRRLPTTHSNNIFTVLFVPHAHDRLLISAAGDHQVLLHDLDHSTNEAGPTQCVQRWECGGRVKKLVTCKEEPRLFWSVSEDGMLKQYDLRDNSSNVLLNLSDEYQLKSLACNEARSEMLAVGVSDAIVPIYDRRNMQDPVMRLLPAHLRMGVEGRFLATHLAFNKQGDELVANIGSDNIYVFDVSNPGKQTSIDLFTSLESFATANDEYSLRELESKQNGVFQPEINTYLNHYFNDEISRFVDEKEFSKAIDKCSEYLGIFSRERGLPPNLFSIPPQSVKNNVRALVGHSDAFAQCLITRGRCFLERNWEGDVIDAIRDFLSVLRISPKQKSAHIYLIKSLIAIKQHTLARKFYSLFCKIHGTDDHIAELGKQLEDTKNEEEEGLWVSDYSKRYRDFVHRYTGHLNINTDIKESNWFGPNDEYIVAGSDCGSIFIWDRKSGNVVRVFKGDQYTVNCVQPHPKRCLVASSGIDNVVRFWEPASTSLKDATENGFPEESEDRDLTSQRYEIMKRNRRSRTPELVWERLLNSVGLGLFRVDSTQEAEDGENDEGEDGEDGAQVIRCRQM